MNLRFLLVAFVLWSCACLAQVGPSFLVVPQYRPQHLVTGAFLQAAGASNTTTFTSVNFGTATADRYLICACWVTNANNDFNSVTIGGVSATTVVNVTNGTPHLRIAIALVTSGTSGNVVLSFTGTGTAFYSLYSLKGSLNATSPITASGTANPYTSTINVPTGALLIGANGVGFNGASMTWTGVTQDTYTTVSTSNYSTASKIFPGGSLGYSIGSNWGSVGGGPTIGFGAFY